MFIHSKVLLLLLFSILLTSCGGGGGGKSISGNEPPPTEDQSMGGLWFGTLTLNGEVTPGELLGLSTDDGRFYFFSLDSGYKFSGTATVDGSDLTGEGHAYSPEGGTWQDGSMISVFSVDAEFQSQSSITGSWTTNSGDTGEFRLSYDLEYEKDSSIEKVTGIWQGYDLQANPIVTFDIWDTGEFQGQNVIGCISIGVIEPVDADFNVYDISSTISNCPIAGSYRGLGSLGERDRPVDTLVLAINNEDRGIVLPLLRLTDPPSIFNTVIVDGKEWLQPVSFRGYTFDQIRAVCPAGACEGRLPGSTFDLTGYTWASIEEVSALFNSYGVDPPFTEPFQTRENQAATAEYFQDFEYITDKGTWLQYGMVRDRSPDESEYYITFVGHSTSANTGEFSNTFKGPDDFGAWFWRPTVQHSFIDNITADGKDWVDPNFFSFTAAQIRDQCPGGICSGTIQLNPALGNILFDLTGYTWASIEEVSSLFNSYGVDPPFTQPFQIRTNQVAVANMANDFWFVADRGTGFLRGMLRDSTGTEETVYTAEGILGDQIGTFRNTEENNANLVWGTWLWKPIED